jgi:hypothetical protein
LFTDFDEATSHMTVSLAGKEKRPLKEPEVRQINELLIHALLAAIDNGKLYNHADPRPLLFDLDAGSVGN